jgi:hypothetical protein
MKWVLLKITVFRKYQQDLKEVSVKRKPLKAIKRISGAIFCYRLTKGGNDEHFKAAGV